MHSPQLALGPVVNDFCRPWDHFSLSAHMQRCSILCYFEVVNVYKEEKFSGMK